MTIKKSYQKVFDEELARMQRFGMAELASPVAEAMRKMVQQLDEGKTCETCRHYIKEQVMYDQSYDMDWCDYNETKTEDDNYCDNWEGEC